MRVLNIINQGTQILWPLLGLKENRWLLCPTSQHAWNGDAATGWRNETPFNSSDGSVGMCLQLECGKRMAKMD